MGGEIKNRVANSKLISLDLEEFYPEGERITLDISKWLIEGFILREKDFREQLKQENWQQFEGTFIALINKNEAIIPAWAFMLITTYLATYAKKIVVGTLEDLENQIFTEIISEIDYSQYKDKFVIVKGCSKKPIPENAYIKLIQKLQPEVKSLMYGEACSSVPLFKKK